MGQSLGGGFQLSSPAYEKAAKSAPKQYLPSLNVDSYLLGIDGHVYHGDIQKEEASTAKNNPTRT
jgi:hypothetical protein